MPRGRCAGHTVIGAADLEAARIWVPTEVDADGIGYLLFTSGSTGQPKGVMVAHRNVVHFVAVMTERYGIDEHDRLSQTFDLTFDLSAFDMFVAWERGACLCCPPEEALMSPARFIREARSDAVVLRAVHGRLHAQARRAEAGRVPLAALEPVLRRAAAGGGRPRVGRREPWLGGREPVRADRAHDRLHALHLGRSAFARAGRARRRPDRRAVPRDARAGRRRGAATRCHGRGRRAAVGRSAGHARLLEGSAEDGGRVRGPAGRDGNLLPHRRPGARARSPGTR